MIAVCGPSAPTQAELDVAEAVGAAVARAGHVLVCGGRGGVMEAASRGAKQAGGVTVGILPGYDPAEANEWIDVPVCTGLGHARNAVVVASGDAVIAIGGGFGTLSEIALALTLGKRVVGLGSWELDPARIARSASGQATLIPAADADEAVRLAIEDLVLGDRRPRRLPSGHG